MPPAPHYSYAYGSGYPTDQTKEQHVTLTQRPLAIQQNCENHGCKHADPAIVEHGDENGRERNGNELGASGE